jgi:hypothetical protein
MKKQMETELSEAEREAFYDLKHLLARSGHLGSLRHSQRACECAE